ncbi:thiamine pyrophosphate-dependent enzyme, partial [Thermoproteota archaeon]
PKIQEIVEKSKYNTLKISEDSEYGIIASGIAYSYCLEALRWLDAENDVNLLKIGCAHPIPEGKVKQLLNKTNKVVVLDEGDPVVELQVRNLAQKIGKKVDIFGKKYNAIFPPSGELDTDIVLEALTKFLDRSTLKPSDEREKIKTDIMPLIAPRSSVWCSGCPHIGSYYALRQAVKKVGGNIPIINGDIGCYEMAGYGVFGKKIMPSYAEESIGYTLDSPYEFLDTLHVMGSGIGVSQGMYHSGYSEGKIIAVTGDSTFFHACIPQMINAVWNNAKITFIIFDNSWTAMTGHQPHPGTGIIASGRKSKTLSIEEICSACGVENVKIGTPLKLEKLKEIMEEAIKSDTLSVVISRSPCAQVLGRQLRRQGKKVQPYYIDMEKCTGCKICLKLGCPAILFNMEKMKGEIDPVLCTGCGICEQICPLNTIKQERPQ